jgi:hypothetical protein
MDLFVSMDQWDTITQGAWRARDIEALEKEEDTEMIVSHYQLYQIGLLNCAPNIKLSSDLGDLAEN